MSSTPPTNADPCLRCRTVMVAAQIRNMRVYVQPGEDFSLGDSTRAAVLVCPACGSVELRAENPELFRKK